MFTLTNVHPFFVHAPLVLIPTAALLVWLGRKQPSDGWLRAIRLSVLGAWLGAVAALLSGLVANSTIVATGALAAMINQHQTNGIVLTAITSVAAILTLCEWRGWLSQRAWWVRGALLTWATIGVFTIGHSGATMVYRHGVGVQASALPEIQNNLH